MQTGHSGRFNHPALTPKLDYGDGIWEKLRSALVGREGSADWSRRRCCEIIFVTRGSSEITSGQTGLGRQQPG